VEGLLTTPQFADCNQGDHPVTPIERYIVRGAGPHKGEWAFIYIDEDRGVFTAVTSYGNYAYIWNHIGTATLKEFLRDLDCDYFMKKARGPGYMRFDFRATVKGMKKHIAHVRRHRWINKDLARDAWDDIERIEDRMSVELFVEDVWSSPDICKAYGNDFDGVIVESLCPQCKGFWEVIWPEFLKKIAPAPAPEAVA
jgi:predicted Zn-ribbon and HTH transcriptional regulator